MLLGITIAIKEAIFVSCIIHNLAFTPQNVLTLWGKTYTEQMQYLKSVKVNIWTPPPGHRSLSQDGSELAGGLVPVG